MLQEKVQIKGKSALFFALKIAVVSSSYEGGRWKDESETY